MGVEAEAETGSEAGDDVNDDVNDDEVGEDKPGPSAPLLSNESVRRG